MDRTNVDRPENAVQIHLYFTTQLLWASMGFVIAVIGVIPAWVVALAHVSGDAGLSSWGQIHATDPLLYVADAFPFVAAVLALWLCRYSHRLKIKNRVEAEANVRLRQDLDTKETKLNKALETNTHVKDDYLRTTAQLRLRLTKLTSPDRVNKTVKLLDILDFEKLQAIQKALSVSLNVYSAVYDLHGDLVTRPTGEQKACRLIRSTQLGEKECYWFTRNIVEKAASHGKPVFKRCHLCGLVCGGAPMIVDDRHLGTWIMGQVRVDSPDEDLLSQTSDKIAIPSQDLLEALQAAPHMSADHFESALDLLWYFSKEVSSLGYANLTLSQNAFKRVRAETELHLLWDAVNINNNAIMIVNADGKIIAASDALCEMLGYSKDDLLGLKTMDVKKERPIDDTMPVELGKRREIAFVDKNGKSIKADVIEKVIGKDNHKYTCTVIIASPVVTSKIECAGDSEPSEPASIPNA